MREVDLVPDGTPNITPSVRKIAEAHADGYVTGAEATKIVGVTYRRTDHAARTGVAPPAIEADGSGTLRLYDLDALVRLKVVTDLYDLGLKGVGGALLGLLDHISGGEPVTAHAGCLTVTVDPSVARAELEPAYRQTINPDPKDQP